jgi:hypothetical protein
MDDGRCFMAFFVKLNLPRYEGPVGLTVEIREMAGHEGTKQKGQQCYDLEDLIS